MESSRDTQENNLYEAPSVELGHQQDDGGEDHELFHKGHKIAAFVLLGNALTNALAYLTGWGMGSPLGIVIDLLLGAKILQRSEGALKWAKIRAFLGLVLFSIFLGYQGMIIDLILNGIFITSLIFLLWNKKPGTLRLVLCSMFTFGILVLTILGLAVGGEA